MTKTEAGTREVPMGAVLREMLLDLARPVPSDGRGAPSACFPDPAASRPGRSRGPRVAGRSSTRTSGSGIGSRSSQGLGLPYVTPHSARHSFISTMQAQGIEVGLVAKIAGHANAVVTLGHYTQAVRGGEAAISNLEDAYGIPQVSTSAA